MKKAFFIGISILFIVPFLHAQEKADTLKILCYNLRFGELASLEELAEFIWEQDPDLVALQEVDCKTYRTGAPMQNGKDFITELGFRTGLLSAYGKTIPYAGGYYGIGILSKFPMASVERIYLPKTENGKEQRAVLVADVEFSENQYITFACTHLDYTNTEERQVQVHKLNEVLLDKTTPVLLCGDFNARPKSEEIAVGMASWKILDDGGLTIPVKNPESKIDYIFGYPKNSWKTIEATTHQIQLSDHLPISALVELKR
ncbi:Metal-dependent hydrolase, endonuclease/exonuclease/phosphatase family [Mariniphaga anaerophila]|uniref:Metal-dependent hydrolase, endonuclease/exonuclease/phosphatase family n=1 Tax=Mariniphaga anaerophila TaxID=1484053 RepID=A0A1M5EGY8_9BACT|nr:endonuclease/exonuclease/phosphatase family protein [Mariniphaga anaerophila]SHF78515.1 Metal-dependent hydrolase, endonuclease/exonuclease/phosphatase family [Mariniphaga anaerophila]